MNNITYVRAGIQHIPVLIESRYEFIADYVGALEHSAEKKFRNELRSFFDVNIPSGNYISYLAMRNDNWIAVGGMQLQQKPGNFRVPNGKSGYIMNMYTLQAYRRQGIATEILRRLINDGKELGLNFFELHASEHGIPVYLKEGFALHDEPTMRMFIQ